MSRPVIRIQPKKIIVPSSDNSGGNGATGGDPANTAQPRPLSSLSNRRSSDTVRIGTSSSCSDLLRCESTESVSGDGGGATRIFDHRGISRSPIPVSRSTEFETTQEEPVKWYKSVNMPHKFHLMILLLPDVKRKFPLCNFTPDSEKFRIEIKGSEASSAYTYMLQMSTKMTHFPLMPKGVPVESLERIMSNRKFEKDISENMSELKAHLYESKEGKTCNIVVGTPDREEEVRKAMDGLFSYQKRELSKDEIFLLHSEKIRPQVNVLEDGYNVSRRIEGMIMEVEGIKDSVQNFMDDLQRLLDSTDHELHREQIHTEPQKWEFVKRFCKPELESCLSAAGGRAAKTSEKKQNGKFHIEISGSEASVKQAVKGINDNILSSVHSSTLELPGKSMLLGISSFTTIEINRMQEEESCLIESQIIQTVEPETSAQKPDVRIAEQEETLKDLAAAADKEEKTSTTSNLTFAVGNIGKFKADVIVCPVAVKKKKPLVEMGAIPKSLAGYDSDLQKKYDKVVPSGGLEEGQVKIVETSGNLAESCQFIIFLGMTYWRAEGSEKVLQKMIYACLDEANKKKASSIAFPTIGCGAHLKFPVYRVAFCFKLCADKTLLKNMKITVVSYDEKTKKKFEDAKYPRTKSSPGRVKSSWGVTPLKFAGPSDAVFNIYAKTTAQIDKVRAEIKRVADNLIGSEEIDIAPYSENLTEEDWRKLQAMEADNLVLKIDKTQGKIRLLGEKSTVENSARDITEILDNSLVFVVDATPECLKRLATMEVSYPQEWEETSKSDMFSGGFNLTKLTQNDYKDIETAVMGTINNTSYIIGRGNDAAGLGGYSTYEIINIERVENPQLYKSYWELRRRFLSNASKKAVTPVSGLGTEGEVILHGQNCQTLNSTLLPGINEYHLLHGTKSDIIGSIMTEGLDFRLGAEGGLFGKGIYLAESLSKADQYADDRIKRTKVGEELTMFVMRVVLGNICLLDKTDGKGYVKYKTPPCIECHNEGCRKHNATCNSVLGVTNGKMRMLFREFVIYERAQCYPEYLIRYKRK